VTTDPRTSFQIPPTGDVQLRDVTDRDLPIFFEHQRDADANRIAAFPARDWNGFMAHWTKILGDETVITKTVLFDGQVAGNVVSWEQPDEREVGYWIGREYWGKGVATRALSEFLAHVTVRPLHAHVAKHNVASIRSWRSAGSPSLARPRGPLSPATRRSRNSS